MSQSKFNVGLMGCGFVAEHGHIPAMLKCEPLNLVSVYDPDAESLKRNQAKFGFPKIYTDVDAFFDSGIDAVTITSPAPCHMENVLMAAARKLPVLCEKPLAMNSGDSEKMIAAMKASGVSLYTAFCYRFSPCALKIRQLVLDKAIGEVRSLRLIYNWNLHGKYALDVDGKRIIQARREGRMLEGGPMVDCGTHQIDLAHFWLNSEVVQFDAYGAWVDDYEAPDHSWLHMDHANGAHTMVEMSYSYHHTAKTPAFEFLYELIGTEGVIRYDRNAERFTMANGKETREFEFHPEKSFSGLYQEWASALATGKSELLTTAEAGMRVVEISRQSTEMAIRKRAGNQ